MAEYGKRGDDLEALDIEVAALSVDSPHRSAALHKKLDLPFELVCDPERKVVEAWQLLNPKEGGGIAYPAVYVIGADRKVQFRSLDRKASRVMPGPVLEFLRGGTAEGASPEQIPVSPDLVTAVKYLGWATKRKLGMKTD